jgi:hypothetical protein
MDAHWTATTARTIDIYCFRQTTNPKQAHFDSVRTDHHRIHMYFRRPSPRLAHMRLHQYTVVQLTFVKRDIWLHIMAKVVQHAGVHVKSLGGWHPSDSISADM